MECSGSSAAWLVKGVPMTAVKAMKSASMKENARFKILSFPISFVFPPVLHE